MLDSQIGDSQIVLLNFPHGCEIGRHFVSAPLSTFILPQIAVFLSNLLFLKGLYIFNKLKNHRIR